MTSSIMIFLRHLEKLSEENCQLKNFLWEKEDKRDESSNLLEDLKLLEFKLETETHHGGE